MKYWKHLLFLGIIAISWMSATDDPRLAKAADLESTYEYQAALDLYNMVLIDNPNDLDVLIRRAFAHMYLEDPSSAHKDLQQVINTNPMKIDGLLAMSSFYTFVHNLDSAVYFTNVAMMMSETFEDQKKSLVSQGDIYLSNENFDKAESTFLKAYEMDQDDYSVLEKVTFALHGQGKDEEAFRYLDMITDENEINDQSLTKMAYLMNKIAMYGEANLYLEQALNLDPENPEAKCHMAFTYMQLGSYKNGLKYINQSIESNPLNSYAYRVRGELYGRMKKNKKACQDLSRSSSLGYVLEYGSDLYELMDQYCQPEE